MSRTTAAITAVNGYVPDYVLTNDILSTMVDTNDEWIISRTGINERRILKGEGKGSSHMAVPAVEGLLKKRGIKAEEIDLLICATVTPDMVFPATANIICDRIGATNAFGYDLMAACSGFIFALVTASKFIESGSHKKVVVVGVDKMLYLPIYISLRVLRTLRLVIDNIFSILCPYLYTSSLKSLSSFFTYRH